MWYAVTGYLETYLSFFVKKKKEIHYIDIRENRY